MTTDVPRALFHDGPHLQAAFLCERVLVERDGVKSVIRIIDRVTHTVVSPDPPQEMEPFDYRLWLFLSFKSGSARGSHDLKVRLVRPSGESPAPFTQTILFEGDDERGNDVIADLNIRLTDTGLYWFDVRLNDVRVTRIPLRVVYMRHHANT